MLLLVEEESALDPVAQFRLGLAEALVLVVPRNPASHASPAEQRPIMNLVRLRTTRRAIDEQLTRISPQRVCDRGGILIPRSAVDRWCRARRVARAQPPGLPVR